MQTLYRHRVYGGGQEVYKELGPIPRSQTDREVGRVKETIVSSVEK